MEFFLLIKEAPFLWELSATPCTIPEQTNRGNKMTPYRKTAISVAVLFLIALVFDIVASNIYPPVLNAPDYLVNAYPNKITVTIGILLDFICAPAMIWIPILLFPLFKMFDERIALGYVVFRLLESILFIFLAINSLSLISLSQDYIKSEAPDVSYFQALGNSIHARIEWATLLYIFVYALGAFLFIICCINQDSFRDGCQVGVFLQLHFC
jgi:hypothetical protein